MDSESAWTFYKWQLTKYKTNGHEERWSGKLQGEGSSWHSQAQTGHGNGKPGPQTTSEEYNSNPEWEQAEKVTFSMSDFYLTQLCWSGFTLNICNAQILCKTLYGIEKKYDCKEYGLWIQPLALSWSTDCMIIGRIFNFPVSPFVIWV